MQASSLSSAGVSLAHIRRGGCTMARREISQNAWRSELDAFSRQHDGWIVTVRVVGHGGDTHVAAHDVPLHGISPLAADRHDLVVTLGTGDQHLAHRIPSPTALAI